MEMRYPQFWMHCRESIIKINTALLLMVELFIIIMIIKKNNHFKVGFKNGEFSTLMIFKTRYNGILKRIENLKNTNNVWITLISKDVLERMLTGGNSKIISLRIIFRWPCQIMQMQKCCIELIDWLYNCICHVTTILTTIRVVYYVMIYYFEVNPSKKYNEGIVEYLYKK